MSFFKNQRERRDQQERDEKKRLMREQKQRDKEEEKRRQEQSELRFFDLFRGQKKRTFSFSFRNYTSLMQTDKMKSNKVEKFSSFGKFFLFFLFFFRTETILMNLCDEFEKKTQLFSSSSNGDTSSY